MRFEELLRKEHKQGCSEGFEQGHESGKAEGENRMYALVSKMMAQGEADKIPMLSDKTFLAEMYRKYDL